MTEVRITTPRGVTLAGTWTVPVDAGDAAIVFAHGFLTDRHAVGWFDKFGARYRACGYATLAFDFSGCGESADDIVTLEHAVEDLRAASGWVADEGFRRQIVHAHGTGATAALTARPTHTRCLVATSPVIEPRAIEWDQVFSASQLDQLETIGHTAIPNDVECENSREHFVISKQTLQDLSMADPVALLTDLPFPALLMFDDIDVERGLAPIAADTARALPPQCAHKVLTGARFSAGAAAPSSGLEDEWREAHTWVTRHVPPR
ncbi:alpha/beta fold hydrolase [Nanchangia anserum]|uniref:Alpha/beta fold hydrolase n=1 Tax=Nanchangia anserum TaxID=2692125 RepID=A0A8I0GGX8_9ACTO|nr:alpha/beta fold hydrolase [Nanchangia anserum]MBD3689809.1 alpha/beta fold hydrolase [Nanchangia anserum]QOX81979.1 alpha/beta fold hydrolase [Nanchangia anserum]